MGMTIHNAIRRRKPGPRGSGRLQDWQTIWAAHGSRLVLALFLASLLALWHLSSQVLPAVLVPSPARVLQRFIEMWSNPAFQLYAGMTVVHVALSVFLAFVIGVSLALLAYFVPVLDLTINRRFTPFFNSFSGMGWAFLSLLWIGINDGAVIFSATLSLLPMTIINATAGLRALNGELVEMSIAFGRSPMRRIRLVLLPLMLPFLMSTLRLLFGVSWQVVLVAELLCGTGGIGTLISMSRQRFATDMILAIALLIFALVYLSDRVVFAHLQRKTKAAFNA